MKESLTATQDAADVGQAFRSSAGPAFGNVP